MGAAVDTTGPKVLSAVPLSPKRFTESLRVLVSPQHPARGALWASRTEAIFAIGEEGLPAVGDPELGHHVPVA